MFVIQLRSSENAKQICAERGWRTLDEAFAAGIIDMMPVTGYYLNDETEPVDIASAHTYDKWVDANGEAALVSSTWFHTHALVVEMGP